MQTQTIVSGYKISPIENFFTSSGENKPNWISSTRLMGADEYAKLRFAMIAVFGMLLGKSMQSAQLKGLEVFF
jgi:hypothetical protein